MFEMKIDMDGLQRALEDAVRRGQNLEPPMKAWAREKRQDIREIIDSGRGMPPLSPRTLENYATTGTSKITKRGANVRASYARRLDAEGKRLKALEEFAIKKYGRVPSGIQKKIDNYHVRLARLGEQVEKAREKAPSERSSGKSQAERGKGGKLLGKVPQTLYGKTVKQGQHFAVIVGSKWRIDGVHNDGDAHVPKREHVFLTGGDVESLKRKITGHCLVPFKGGK